MHRFPTPVALRALFLFVCLALPGTIAATSEYQPDRRLPADFEEQEAVAIGMTQMVEFHPEVLVHVVEALTPEHRVLGLVSSPEQERRISRLLHAHAVDPLQVEFVRAPVQTMWARDYGPLFVEQADSTIVLDAQYVGTRNNPHDGELPRLLANWLQLQFENLPLAFEGGNVLSNGEELALTSTKTLLQNVPTSREQVREIQLEFARATGAERVAYLQPLEGEPTQHVDMFCVLVASNVAVVAKMDPEWDRANAERLDRNAETLAGLESAAGPMQVHRLSMPPQQDGIWRSYTNLLIANDVVLIPSYAGPFVEYDHEALRLYRRLFPDRKIVPINVESLARRGGTLHCVSFQIPAFVEVPDIGG